MPKKEEKMGMYYEECCGMHKRAKAFGIIVLGLLVLANAYWPFMSWAGFIGGVLVLAGLWKLAKPQKHHR